MDWKAVTESGRVYTCRSGIFTIEGDSYTAFKVWTLRVTTEEATDLPNSELDPAWKVGTTHWVDAKLPVAGRRLYLSGKDSWRLSTTIVSVEELPDDED